MDKKTQEKSEAPFREFTTHQLVFEKIYSHKPIICGLVILLLFFIQASAVHSEEIPWSGRSFFHISEDQPVESFLKDLFMSEEILANISASIEDTRVSGKFNKPAKQVFQQIKSTFNLISYFDGQVVYITPANEIESATIKIKHASVKNVKKSLDEMGIIDPHFQLRYYPKQRMVRINGPKIYVERISEALETIDVYQTKRKKNGSPGQIAQNVRIFRLKHAWAADRKLKVGERMVTIQGVATILKGLTQNHRFESSVQYADESSGAGVKKVKETTAKGKTPEVKQKEQPLADVDYRPESRHTIQCAERLNAVIINANPANMAYYEQMIAELDVPLQLIEIKASIIDVDSEALSSIGLDLNGNHKDGDDSYTYNSDVIAKNNPLFNLTKIPISGSGGLSFSAILGDLADDHFALRLKALASKGKAKIVSKPSIITFDNIEARFTNTETFYVRVAAQDDASLYEISAGIILKVTPHLIIDNHNPKIQLMIAIEDGKIKGSVVDEIPVVESSTINTQAVVSGNESLLIGGLIYDTHKEVDRKVPLLGDIPMLGNLFRSKDKIDSKTERMFLISPRILSVDGNANVIEQDSKSHRKHAPYRNWPPIKLFETTF